MAYRDIPLSDQQFKKWASDTMQRLDRIEGGQAWRGVVSFDGKIQVGQAYIEVTPGGGGANSITVKVVNAATGSELVLAVLP